MYWKRVLIVEDDPFLRHLLADVLGREYEVLLAGDGDEGLRVALAAEPDAALIDLMMPVSSGLEMIRAMHRDASTCRIPVIVMSSCALKLRTHGLLTKEANVRGCFNKGSDLKTLRAKLSELFASQPAHA